MSESVYTFHLDLTMKLMTEFDRINRFDAEWSQIERREGQTLKQLKAIATVRSVGASTRIEGSQMTDAEVKLLIDQLKVSKLEERDEQEVAGYFDALDTIAESYRDIQITEGNIQNLHKILMSYSTKDEWHRGRYKQLSNAVEASRPDGTKNIVFRTTEPGFQTEDAMRKLIDWYRSDNATTPIVKTALFVYDFLSIHPFQDGNGRLSRLLGTLLLLQNGYSWIQYVSFEHEIENRKAEYYQVLMQTQKQRPGESVNDWVTFFLSCMINIQTQLKEKLNTQAHNASYLAPREKNILAYIENHPGSKSSEISEKLNIPLPTVKKALSSLLESKAVIKYGAGAGTNYVAEIRRPLKKDLMFQLTDSDRKKEFLLVSPDSFIEIKKVILRPLFEWITPDEWYAKLIGQNLNFKITGTSRSGSFSRAFLIATFINPLLFQPILTLSQPINIPAEMIVPEYNKSAFPIRAEIELTGLTEKFDFDVMFVYDEQE